MGRMVHPVDIFVVAHLLRLVRELTLPDALVGVVKEILRPVVYQYLAAADEVDVAVSALAPAYLYRKPADSIVQLVFKGFRDQNMVFFMKRLSVRRAEVYQHFDRRAEEYHESRDDSERYEQNYQQGID